MPVFDAQSAIDGEYLTNYPTFHIMADDGCICNCCIRSESALVLEATAAPGTDKQWEYVTTTINYEDEHLYCDHCSKRIVAAYEEDDTQHPGETEADTVW